jgi:copper chaperone
MSVQTFSVTGMTCGHCVQAVTAELGHLPGVTEVAVDLDAEGTSTVRVTADAELSATQVAEALDEAGDYQLVPAG